MKKVLTQTPIEFIEETLDKEPEVTLLIAGFVKGFRESLGGRVSVDDMKGIYNQVLFLVCNVIEFKNDQRVEGESDKGIIKEN